LSSSASEIVEPAAVSAPPQRVGRNMTVLAAGQLITWTMTLLWTLVVPRKLGPSGLGTVMAAWSITGIFGIVLGMGTKNYLVRLTVVDPDAAPRGIGTTLVARTLLSPLVFGAAVAYGEAVHWNHEGKIVLYLAAAATVFVQIAEPLQAGFQAAERMEYLAYSDIISKSGQGLVGIVVVLLGAGTIGVTACMAVMSALVVLLDLQWMRGRFRIDVRTSVRQIAAVTRGSLSYWAFGVFFMLYLWIDFVMLSLLTREEVVGWYSVPTRLFQTLMFLPVVVSTAWLPRFVRGFAQGGDELGKAARQPVVLVLLLSLPIAAFAAVAAHPVIHLLYGSAYNHAVPVMALLALSIPPMYLNIMLSYVLVAMDRQSSWTWVMVVTTIVNPIFNIVLIPYTQHRYGNGAIGAAVALALTELVVVGLGARLVGRMIFDAATIRRTVFGVGAALAMWAAGYAAQRIIGDAAGIVVAAVTFVLLAGALRLFTADELALMRGGLDRVVRKLSGGRRGGSAGNAVRQPS
jgi:O-antigen/teichoic acid export membrane protein